MEEFLIYLIKSSGILTLFWLCFKLFLQNETFFTLHRVYLLSGILLALLFPFWTLTEMVMVEPLSYSVMGAAPITPTPVTGPAYDWWNIGGTLYLIGFFFFLGRFALQLFSLGRLLRKGVTNRKDGFVFIETREDTSPFSFFHIIVYNPALYSRAELETILAHEKVHSRQGHSLDILLVHLFSAFQWINPVVWCYKTTLSQNLEFMADQGVTKNMEGNKDYQYLLLKNALTSIPHSSIINPIFNSSIKKRIVMLNKNRSHQFKAWKFSLVIPFLAFFLVAFNTKTVTQIHPQTIEHSRTSANGETDSKTITFTINKNSTAADLEHITVTLKKEYNILQSFSDIERNQEGVLIKISSSFTVSNADKSITTGTNTFNDSNGIKPFSIYVETDKDKKIISMGHETMENNNMKGLNIVGSTDPFYIVDGVEYKEGDIPDLDPSGIESINVLKGPAAINKYGDKGKNGVIEIITKKNKDLNNRGETIQIRVDPKGTDPDVGKKKPPTITIEGAKVSDSTSADSLDMGPSTITITGHKVSDARSADTLDNAQPLIIINGAEMDANYRVDTISPDDIENVTIYRDEIAIQKFGEKGKNGVIDITTKKNKP